MQFPYLVGVIVEVGADVTVTEGVGDGVSDCEGNEVGVAEGVGVGVAVGSLGLGVGLLTTTLTPLPQTSFFPDFMHLYLYPAYVFVEFNLVQDVPAFMAALAGKVKGNRRPIKISNESNRFIASQYCQRLTSE